ncbi:MAG TPA: energy-coupled thiamine transporter ThiT [Methanofastidiosum sp.]|nr:energy-coupled thiamine transporter ThiT [Methanofastidiosum sp.]HPA49746.1 energy-coupled thiamine transporter ThiT [Methanofastidiosum sp.]HQK63187.1 energy-coupled thiamine transporter ThiT [Methanofastidiosum sp.]HQM94916.1 energy-coupled thiamine transporter ThiT [Methanofastidiosum sp.]HQQ48690.1 energy-coupled thiamine transporter ThiT [Methanofastidiosum sp.]
MEHKTIFSAREISEMAITIALSTVLSFIKVFQMPQGGSITAGSMIPLIYLALRNRPKVAITGAVLYGLVQFMVEPFFVHPAQFLLDYPLAFGALGIATLIKKYPLVGTAIGVALRFVCHFLSGFIFFGMYAPEGLNPIYYSALYNGSYLLPEMVVTAIFIYILSNKKLIDAFK